MAVPLSPTLLAVLGYAATLLFMSFVTFVVFAWDKRRARHRGWRVSEKTLRTLELLGGWPGAWLGMRWLRHKSSKRSYRWRFGVAVAVHVGLVAGAVAWWLYLSG
ncbi:MAG: DUF1294 domain-containing protein [Planctomycetota bacterium]